ncbi:MAG: hypothetical protein GF411_19050, partial [Candidatus Lokiarchaeota archaeon]|nr:hypothetical protein [Candidatus Lokiarchaeota archaeon]
MNKILVYTLMLFLITPIFVSGLNTTLVQDDSVSVEMESKGPSTEVPEISMGDSGYTAAYFTQTYSSEDGFYYLCKRGPSTIAYFGASKVIYVLEGTTITLEFPESQEVIPEGLNPT